MKFLVFGGLRGWIGQKLVEMLQQDSSLTVVGTQCRTENHYELLDLLQKEKPDRVILAAGVTGRPNVDWCENHQNETVVANVIGPITLFNLCAAQNIHVTYLATGCIYEYDVDHPMPCDENNFTEKTFTENDEPNFHGSFYSRSKIACEKAIKECFPNVLTLRLRMPISNDLHPRSFVTKIASYEKVVNIPNSMSVLQDLLPCVTKMAIDKRVGFYNFCNPGVVSHNEILELYKKHVRKDFTWKNFSVEEQAQVIKAGRSNNALNVSKLLELFPNIPNVKTSLEKLFVEMGKELVP